jgi:hypothetical protein
MGSRSRLEEVVDNAEAYFAGLGEPFGLDEIDRVLRGVVVLVAEAVEDD